MAFNKQLALILGAACLLIVIALSLRNLNTDSQVLAPKPTADNQEKVDLTWISVLESDQHLSELPSLIQSQLKEDTNLESDSALQFLNESIVVCEKNKYFLPATFLKLKRARHTEKAEDWEAAGEALYGIGANTGDSLYRVFFMQEVVNAMDKALEKNQELVDAKLYKGMALADDRNKIMQAVPLLKQVEAKDPDNTLALYTLGLLSIESRQLDKALQRFEKLVSLQPSKAEYHYQLGRVAELSGKKEDALRHYQQSLKLTNDPNTKGYIENIIKNLQ